MGPSSSCAVVGSSGDLLHSGLGPAIDGHDAVFRINEAAAPAKLHADAGTRTTFRVATHWPWRMMVFPRGRPSLLRGSRADRLPVVPLLYCHNRWVGKCHDDSLHPKWWMNNTMPRLLNPVLAGTVSQMAGGARRGLVPTAGLMAVAAALAMCGRVSIFGFSDGTNASACAYYFDRCKMKEREYANLARKSHDLAHQRRVLRLLASRREITWVGPGGRPVQFQSLSQVDIIDMV